MSGEPLKAPLERRGNRNRRSKVQRVSVWDTVPEQTTRAGAAAPQAGRAQAQGGHSWEGAANTQGRVHAAPTFTTGLVGFWCLIK